MSRLFYAVGALGLCLMALRQFEEGDALAGVLVIFVAVFVGAAAAFGDRP